MGLIKKIGLIAGGLLIALGIGTGIYHISREQPAPAEQREPINNRIGTDDIYEEEAGEGESLLGESEQKIDEKRVRAPLDILVSGNPYPDNVYFVKIDDLTIPDKPKELDKDSLNKLYKKLGIDALDYEVKDRERLEKFLEDNFAKIGYSLEKAKTAELKDLKELLLKIDEAVKNNVEYFSHKYAVDIENGYRRIRAGLDQLVSMEIDEEIDKRKDKAEIEELAKKMEKGDKEADKKLYDIFYELRLKILEKHMKEDCTPEQFRNWQREVELDKKTPEEALYGGVALCRHYTKIFGMIFDYIKSLNPNLGPANAAEVHVCTSSDLNEHIINSIVISGEGKTFVSQIDTTNPDVHDSDRYPSFGVDLERIMEHPLFWASYHLIGKKYDKAISAAEDVNNPEYEANALEIKAEAIAGKIKNTFNRKEQDSLYDELEKTAEKLKDNKNAYLAIAEASYSIARGRRIISREGEGRPQDYYYKKQEQALLKFIEFDGKTGSRCLSELYKKDTRVLDFQKGLELCDTVFAKHLPKTNILYTKGVIYYKLGQFDKAIEAYQELLKQEIEPELRKNVEQGIEYFQKLKNEK